MQQTNYLSKLKLSRLFLSLLILPFMGGCEKVEEVKVEERIRPVRYYTLAPQQAGENIQFSGAAIAGKESSLSFKVSGTINRLAVKVGDSVTRGALLAELDKTDLEVDVDGARASLRSAEADTQAAITKLNTTRSNYSRIEKLYESNNVSLSEFEQARGDFETVKAQLKAAKSQVTTAQSKLTASKNQLNYTELTAPFDGVVNTIALDENEEVSPGTTVMTLSGFNDLEVRINLSDIYISRVKEGLGCEVRFPALEDRRFTGVVSEVPYATTEAPTYPVIIKIETADQELRPGMAAEVMFNFGGDSTQQFFYLLPDSVGEEGGSNFVFVLNDKEDGIAIVEKRPVELGGLSEKGFLVKKGVKESDKIASSGLQILLEGMEVKLLKDPVTEW